MPLGKPPFDKPPITFWSYSKWQCYTQCPQLCRYRHVDKLPEPKGKALLKGNEYHDLAERFVKGELHPIPPELRRFKNLLEMLRDDYLGYEGWVGTEEMWVFDKDWNYIGTWKYGDPWVQGTWLFIKMDLWQFITQDTVVIRDWKTGKLREDDDYISQLELYALSAFQAFDGITEVKTALHYLELGQDAGVKTYRVEEVPELMRRWNTRIKRMLNDRVFRPNPSYACGYCHFSKKRGGPCEY